jgi:hypothetical protein
MTNVLYVIYGTWKNWGQIGRTENSIVRSVCLGYTAMWISAFLHRFPLISVGIGGKQEVDLNNMIYAITVECDLY